MKQKGLKIISAIVGVVITLCIVSNLFAHNSHWYIHLISVFEVGAFLLACIYMHKGCKKDAAKYYHWFAVSFMILQGSIVILMARTGKTAPCLLCSLIAYGYSMLLAFAENLGKKRSNLFAGGILLINTIGLIMKIVSDGGIMDGTMAGFGSMVLLSLLLYACVQGKYVDKDARGTI